MSKNFQEPEEVELDKNNSEAEVIDDFNPLDEAVLEKPYTKPNVKLSSSDMNMDIPEPTFTPPPITQNVPQEERPKRVAPQPKPPVNESMRDLPKKDKREAAKKFAEMIMSGYKMANDLVDKSLLINEGKIKKLEAEGLIDTSMIIPVSPTDSMTVSEYISEFNSQTEGTISVSKEFEEEVMPVLTDVLEESGVGLTNKQYLGYLVIKDIAAKSILVFQSISVKKAMIEQLKEATIAYREHSTILQSQYNNQQRTNADNSNNNRREEPPTTPSYAYDSTPPEKPSGGGNSMPKQKEEYRPMQSDNIEDVEFENEDDDFIDNENDFDYGEEMNDDNDFDSEDFEDDDFDEEDFDEEDFDEEDFDNEDFDEEEMQEDFKDVDFEETDFENDAEETDTIETVNNTEENVEEFSDEQNPLDDNIVIQEPEENKKEDLVVAKEVIEVKSEMTEETKEEDKTTSNNDYVQQKPTVTIVPSPNNTDTKKKKGRPKKNS